MLLLKEATYVPVSIDQTNVMPINTSLMLPTPTCYSITFSGHKNT